MKWLVAWILMIVGLCGCRSSQTSYNTLAPFGSSRVPPPSTNYFNASGNYYNRPATPQTATPAMPGSAPGPAASQPGGSTSGQIVPHASADSSGGNWLPPARTAAASPMASDVRPVSHERAAEPATNGSPSDASDESTLRLRGMPITDVTTRGGGVEPARFVPASEPIEIAQLPAAPPGSSGAPAGATVVASSRSSDQQTANPPAPQSTLNWKSRP